MAKVTIKTKSTPSNDGALPLAGAEPSQVVPKSKPVLVAKGDRHVVIDELGRELSWAKLPILQRIRFHDMLGAHSSENRHVIGPLAVAATCRSIDGDEIPFPTKRIQLEATLNRIGDEGLAALHKSMEAIAKAEGQKVDDEDEDNEEDEGADDTQARAKN